MPAFGIGHQGAELFSAEGEKMGVLAVFGGFQGYLGPIKVDKVPTKHVQVSLGVLGPMLETFAHRRCMRSAFRCVP